MTVYDVSALIIMSLGAIGLLGAGLLALLGRKRAATIMLRGVGAAIACTGTSAAMAVVSKQPPLGVGDPQCIDSWCIAVENVKSTPRDQTNVYDVTLCIFSRAERTRTSFGAHASADNTAEVYLVDATGRGTIHNPAARKFRETSHWSRANLLGRGAFSNYPLTLRTSAC
jgi:hypothetical protein